MIFITEISVWRQRWLSGPAGASIAVTVPPDSEPALPQRAGPARPAFWCGSLSFLRLEEQRWHKPKILGCEPAAVAAGGVNEEALKRLSCKVPLPFCWTSEKAPWPSEFQPIGGLGCWTWSGSLLSNPRVPAGSRSSPGISKKGSRKGSSLGKCKNLIVLC